MEISIIETLVVLGVPGVALGVFYLLLRSFGFKFSTISSTWAAIIAIVFLLVAGGITFYGLQQWSPKQAILNIPIDENAETSNKLSTKYKQASAFQISWLVMSLLTNNARHPEAVYAQLYSHSGELGLSLPEGYKNMVRTDDGGDSVMSLVSSLGGQLVSKEPGLIPYFEAGFNLVLDVGRSNGANIGSHVENLDIPDELKHSKDTPLAWINKIHDYFEKTLRNKK
jgi:hypothetical protein